MYLEKYDLKGRVAFVTGGGQGIGLSCAEALAEAGAKVVILDVTDSGAVDETAARFNRDGRAVDILVCNAGIARSGTPAEEVTDEHWRNVLDVNLNAVFWCCRS